MVSSIDNVFYFWPTILEVTLAANESMETGKPIELDVS
jgi:hypothetical protein